MPYTNNIIYTPSSSTTNSKRASFTTMIDVDQQKENKFKQIFDQSTIDLGNYYFRLLNLLFVSSI